MYFISFHVGGGVIVEDVESREKKIFGGEGGRGGNFLSADLRANQKVTIT